MVRRLLAIAAMLVLAVPSAASAVTPAPGTWVGRSAKGEWVTFTVRDGYIHNFQIAHDPHRPGDPELLSARIAGGQFQGYAGTVGYRGTWCDTHHIAGLRDARQLGDPNPLHWYAHLEHTSNPGNPCPRETFHTPSSATVAPGEGAWSGHTKNGADIVFTIRDGRVLNLRLGRNGNFVTIFGDADLDGGAFEWNSHRGRVVKGRFCDPNHMAGIIIDTREGVTGTVNFAAHRSGHGQPGESPCPPLTG